jgi:hypothetical protein
MLSFFSPKKIGICWISRLSTGELKNEIGHVTHQSIGNFIKMKKVYTFRGPKSKNRSPQPKNGIIFVWYIDREFYMWQEKIYFWGSKGRKKSYRAHKRNLGPGRVIFKSFVNFTWSKKNIILGSSHTNFWLLSCEILTNFNVFGLGLM